MAPRLANFKDSSAEPRWRWNYRNDSNVQLLTANAETHRSLIEQQIKKFVHKLNVEVLGIGYNSWTFYSALLRATIQQLAES